MTARQLPASHDLSAWEDVSTDDRIVTVDGPNISLMIRRGCLVIKDGPYGTPPRERIIAKVPRVVERLNIYSTHGLIQAEVFAWLHDAGIQWTIMSRDDKHPIHLGSSDGYTDTDMVYAQAEARIDGSLSDAGLAIMRRLIRRKLQGQADNARRLLNRYDVATYIEAQIVNVESAPDVEEIRGYEGDAAGQYWQAWAGFQLSWRKPHPIAPSWLRTQPRKTLLRTWESNADATDPVNAMLNWCYKIAETECAHRITGAAMSPALGIMHADVRKRDSFALDLVEVLRPACDAIVWDYIQDQLNPDLFRMQASGVCTVAPPLTHHLANLVRAASQDVMPDLFYAERALDAAGAQLRADHQAAREAREAARKERRKARNKRAA